MVKTRLYFWAVLSLMTGIGTLGAQTVAEEIIKGQEVQGIDFLNYIGPHRVIESRSAIQGIGADLGRQMKVAGATEADYGGKYQVLRIHDPSSDLLSADLFILKAGAGVDHIRNLNWIVSAYLQQAFGYSINDADLLSSFVTRYNAFYRGQLDYLRSHYIPAVAGNVTAENAGLALSYTEWPGKTRIFIPLRDSLSKGPGGSLNTEEVSNKEIITKMAQEPGAGVADRKKLADLKEGEIIQEAKAVAQTEARIAAAPSSTGTTTIGPSTQTPTPPGSTTAPATGPPTAAAGSTSTVPLDQAKRQLAARDQALQAERLDIVKQETLLPDTKPLPAEVVKPASTAAFVRMTETTKTGQVWLIDPNKNTVWKKSELNTVRQPRILAFGSGFLVVAGDNAGANGAVRLVLLSPDDASVQVTGTDDVLPDTPLLISGNQVLAVTKGAGGWILGTFDTALKPIARGTDVLSALTSVVPTTNGILVQTAGGAVILLDTVTLKKKTNTEG